MKNILIAIFFYPFLLSAQQQTDYIFKATSTETFTWVSPASMKSTLGISNITGTWADSTRANFYAALSLKVNISDTATMLTNYARNSSVALKAAAGANTDITSILLNQTGLVVKGGSANALTIKPNETLSAGRTLNIVTGDVSRTLTFTGDASVSGTSSGTNTGDQTITLTGDVTGTGTGSFATTIAAPSSTTVNNNTGGWVTFKVSGSDVTTTGQTLVDVTGLVTGTLSVSSNYEIEAMLIVATSAVTTGTEYGVNCTGTGTSQGIIYIGPTTVTAGVQVMAEDGTNVNNTAATPAMLTTASETGVVWIRGVVGTGTGSPTIAIRHLKVTSGTSTVKIGSTLRIRKI